LRMVGMVESECTCKGETTREFRFYISSLEVRADFFAKAVRSHWGIENSLHWVLDMAFREDESRIRMGNAAENFSMIRRLALNLIKQEKSIKNGVKAKRLHAGWDDNYFLKIISG
jgi:predicted transposase YbfD/YdcC